MATKFEMKITGIRELLRAIEDPKILLLPLKRFLLKSGVAVQKRAGEKVPVDTGHLKLSIKPRIEGGEVIIEAHAPYAAAVEFGTKPHSPPLGALQPWAKRHGFGSGLTKNGFDIGALKVRAIIRKRGTKAQPFMEPALRDSESDIEGFLEEMGQEIERAWGQNG